MKALSRRWARIGLTLLPVLLALLHATGVWRLSAVEQLDRFIYDLRLRATVPGTLDDRIVIIDIDDASLKQLGQWPWRRAVLAHLTHEVITRQQAAVLGFDMVFAESNPDDPAFAQALAWQPVALGYYFTRSAAPQASGQLPAPLLAPGALSGGRYDGARWNGFGANVAPLAQAAPAAGFINADIDAASDGVLRAAPLIAHFEGAQGAHGYYESLALAVYRLARGSPAVTPIFAPAGWGAAAGATPLEALLLHGAPGRAALRVPVDASGSVLVPYRGRGGPAGGSFRYISAARVLNGDLAADELRGKIVLVGATAPGLYDLRATPVSATFPGVEVHANVISGMLDRRLLTVPDYVVGYSVAVLLLVGLLLAFGLSLLRAPLAVLLVLVTGAALIGLNSWLYLRAGLVLPLAAALVMTALAFVVNMSWAYFVEARARQGLMRLFGTYVPPALVQTMLRHPHRYSMRAESKELTVMFCDMRGFTALSETMAPADLQSFLNTVFSRLTDVISAHHGTVDKYMGDCVMAFWGAPVDAPEHAALAVQAAIGMVAAVHQLNQDHRASGWPQFAVGIGLNTGLMSVGDMGSAVRRSYTVIGDAVNLASRLEGLGRHYGVQVVASAATRAQAPLWLWQELDRVRVRGRAQVVSIFTPLALAGTAEAAHQQQTLERWTLVLSAYRAQDWARAQAALAPLLAHDAKKVLYQLYAERLASMALQSPVPDWDGATRLDIP